MQTRFVHSSLAVTDLDRSIAFYKAAFEAEVVLSDHDVTDLIARTVGVPGTRAALAQLRFPGTEHTLELISFSGVPAEQLDRVPVRPGHGHVCFGVCDLDEAITETERLGAIRVGEVVTFPGECRTVYMREPAGSVFELEEPEA
jgi:predicted enzyme related to lactoylglutathione lyase